MNTKLTLCLLVSVAMCSQVLCMDGEKTQSVNHDFDLSEEYCDAIWSLWEAMKKQEFSTKEISQFIEQHIKKKKK